jgi:hypothetical protein
MINIKHLIPILLKFLLLQSVYCQTQIDIPEYISQRFQSYCKSVPREEIFIHTDKSDYVAGEDMWFNIYLIDRQSSKPSEISKIVYFEVLNFDNKPVVQKRILMDKGYGPGQCVLPDTLSSGTYTIRAYSNWMKNFLPFNCYYGEINIYSTQRTKIFKRSVKAFDTNETAAISLQDNNNLNLTVNNLRTDSLELHIATDEKFRLENKNTLYLFIQSHGIINHLSSEELADSVKRITIPKSHLSAGINQITIFDSNGAVCDRLIYIPSEEKQSMSFHSGDTCGKRNKVILDIETTNGSDQLVAPSNLSISVSSEISSSEIPDLVDYMIFGSEFGISPLKKFKSRNIIDLPPEEIDSILSSAKSNWIIWEQIFSNTDFLFKYPPETEYQYLSGRLMVNNLEPTDSGEILLMSTVDKVAEIQYTRTDRDGNFNFRINIDEDIKDFIIQPDINSKGRNVYLESAFPNKYYDNVISIDSMNKEISDSRLSKIVNYQVREIYGSSSVGQRMTPLIPVTEPTKFYGKPDFELVLSDYIRLDSMPEVFFELVPRVSFEKINNLYEMSILDPARIKIDGTPCVMIDGVVIKDLSIIANLEPAYIKKIDVVYEKYRVGGYSFNGIINLISKSDEFDSRFMSHDAVRLRYKVFDTSHSFVSPVYSTDELRNRPDADYRTTLYWNHSVKPDQNGKATIVFWTSDLKSDYLINIQGISPEGKPVSLRKTIRVK